MAEQVAVRLVADIDVAYGEEVLVCGSVASFGSWELSQAALMKWQDGAWTLLTPLPCGVRVELKIVVRPQGGGVRWLGIGPGGTENVVLETSLGRGGAGGSRFVAVDGLPFGLTVQDLSPEEAEGDEGHTLAVHRGQAQGSPPQPVGMSPGPQTMAVPTPEVAAAFMLAGQAGSAGHAVTYTTTTTTTTAVTINGAGCGEVGLSDQLRPEAYAHDEQGIRRSSPDAPALTYGPQAPVAISDEGPDRGGDESRGPPPPEASEKEQAALVAARMCNAGVPRAGPAPLSWQAPGAQDVRVRGSWDGWKRELSLEPAPRGGFRLMLILPPGEFECKFVVDGVWTTSDDLERTTCANRNNLIRVTEMVLVPVPLGAPLSSPDATGNLPVCAGGA